jgi:DNA invertase Pin-like site-specific DNA recombinase
VKLAGYLRVSTEGQVDAFGKDVQREAIQRWAALSGHEIVAWFEEDGVSGKTDGGDRPALAALVASDGSYEGLVAFDATRIARRLVVQETLLALVWGAGLKVFTTTAGELSANDDDPTRILIRQILGVIAEFDHRNTVKRLHSGRVEKSAQGGYIGGTPAYGLKVVGTGKSSRVVHDLDETRIIEEVVRRKALGESLRDIANSLNRREIPTKMGKQWTPVQVSRILKRYATHDNNND